ncbi:hypothetical protein ACIRD9_42505 [Streptomyces violaceus]|uniref:hypothetical protein n=1 Tax=Streptomyces violaceus TaxID=1936 RepID=UPI00380A559D
MPVVKTDAVGHGVSSRPATSLTASAVSTTTAGTISGTTAAGAAPTVAIPSGFVATDRAGTFDLTAVTGGGAQAAGVVATVRFAAEYASTPAAVVVTLHNTTPTPDVPIIASATAVATTGFDVLVAAALTTANVYRISYQVIPGGAAGL